MRKLLLLAFIDRQARRLEDTPIGPGPYLAAFTAIVAARHVLEILVGGNPVYFPIQFYLHYPLAYVAPLLALVLVLHRCAGVPVVRVGRLMLYAWALTLLPPLVDLLLGRGGEAIGYMRPEGAGLATIFLRFLDPTVEFAGTTPGIRFETATACALGAAYVVLRRRDRLPGWRLAAAAAAAAVGVYATALGFFTLPRLFEATLRTLFGWQAPTLYGPPSYLTLPAANPEAVTDVLYTLYLVPLCLLLGAWTARRAGAGEALAPGVTGASLPAVALAAIGLTLGAGMRAALPPRPGPPAPVDLLAAAGLVLAAALVPPSARLLASGRPWAAAAAGGGGLALAVCCGPAAAMLVLTALALEAARRMPPLDLDRRQPAGALAAAVAALALLAAGTSWALGQEALLLAPRHLLAVLMAAVALHALAPSARRLGAWAPLALRLAAAATLVVGLRPPPAAAAAALALPPAAAVWSGWRRRHPGAASAAFGVALAVVAGSTALAPEGLDAIAQEASARPRLWVWRGMQAARAGDSQAALAAYRRALATDPRQAGVHAAVGEILWNSMNDATGAEAAFRAALAADPADTASRGNLGRLLRTAGRPEEGLSVLAAGLAQRPDEPLLWLESARCLADLEQPDQEADAWRRYLETSAGRPGHEDARAEARVRLFRLDGAGSRP